MEEAQFLELAHQALNKGARAEAAKYFIEAIKVNPRRLSTWLDLEKIVDDPIKKKQCLTYVLNADPANAVALERMRLLDGMNVPTRFPQVNPEQKSAVSETGTITLRKIQPAALIGCPSCNRQAPAGEKNCPYCGAALAANPEQKPPTAIPPIPTQPMGGMNVLPVAQVERKTVAQDFRVNFFPGEEIAEYKLIDLSYAPVSTKRVNIAAQFDKQERAMKRDYSFKSCLAVGFLICSVLSVIVYIIALLAG